MKIDSVKGTVVVAILSGFIVYHFSGIGPTASSSLTITVSTFLFGIIAGFFISRLNSRFETIHSGVTKQDALFFTFYETSKTYSKPFAKKVSEVIDDMYLVSFEYELGDDYRQTTKHIEQLYSVIAKEKKKLDAETYELLLGLLSDIEIQRNDASAAFDLRLTKGQWLVQFILGIVIIFTLFYSSEPTLLSQVITVLLTSAVVLLLLIMKGVQDLNFSGGGLLNESGQEVFEAMGKLRYYHCSNLVGGFKVPKHITKYRFGAHKTGEKRDIRVITRT